MSSPTNHEDLLRQICKAHGLDFDDMQARVQLDLTTGERVAIEDVANATEAIRYAIMSVLYLRHDLVTLEQRINTAVEILTAE